MRTALSSRMASSVGSQGGGGGNGDGLTFQLQLSPEHTHTDIDVYLNPEDVHTQLTQMAAVAAELPRRVRFMQSAEEAKDDAILQALTPELDPRAFPDLMRLSTADVLALETPSPPSASGLRTTTAHAAGRAASGTTPRVPQMRAPPTREEVMRWVPHYRDDRHIPSASRIGAPALAARVARAWPAATRDVDDPRTHARENNMAHQISTEARFPASHLISVHLSFSEGMRYACAPRCSILAILVRRAFYTAVPSHRRRRT